MKHAEQHDTLVDGSLETGELEGERVTGGILENLHGRAAIWKALLGEGLAIDGYQ